MRQLSVEIRKQEEAAAAVYAQSKAAPDPVQRRALQLQYFPMLDELHRLIRERSHWIRLATGAPGCAHVGIVPSSLAGWCSDGNFKLLFPNRNVILLATGGL